MCFRRKVGKERVKREESAIRIIGLNVNSMVVIAKIILSITELRY